LYSVGFLRFLEPPVDDATPFEFFGAFVHSPHHSSFYQCRNAEIFSPKCAWTYATDAIIFLFFFAATTFPDAELKMAGLGFGAHLSIQHTPELFNSL
jgi:hypothetical protein